MLMARAVDESVAVVPVWSEIGAGADMHSNRVGLVD